MPIFMKMPAPVAVIRLTLPDLSPVDTTGLDVKGFVTAEAAVTEAQEDDVRGYLSNTDVGNLGLLVLFGGSAVYGMGLYTLAGSPESTTATKSK